MTDILSKHSITFDEATHQYRRNGFPLPSVTQILPFKCDGAEDVIRKAAERGHRVHKWIELVESNPDMPITELFREITPGDERYCEAWLKFKEITGFELARFTEVQAKDTSIPAQVGAARIATALFDRCIDGPMVERFVFHPLYNYVGRLDLIGYLRRIPGLENDLILVDAKTVASVYPTTSLQCAAYQQAINLELKALGLPLVKHRWAAQLRPDGSCRRFSFTDHKGDFSVFLARLNWMRWAIANGYEQVAPDPFVEPEAVEREVEEVMARL